MTQRLFDIIFASIAIVTLVPLVAPIILILRLTGEGEVFFLQTRIGRGGKNFSLIKFATMLKDSPAMGSGTVTVKNDPRILPFGRFLRITKVNELPQLINILKGDMSVIGPRPLTNQTFEAYPLHIRKVVIRVRPGLSGIGSIIFRSEEDILHDDAGSFDFYKNAIAPYKGALEEWYVSNYGLRVYFLSIFVTVWAVIFPSTKLAWRAFGDLPTPPDELKHLLGYAR